MFCKKPYYIDEMLFADHYFIGQQIIFFFFLLNVKNLPRSGNLIPKNIHHQLWMWVVNEQGEEPDQEITSVAKIFDRK